MATTRDLKLEQSAVDSFIKYQNKKPSTPDDWKTIHTSAYGTELPPELASLDMYKSTTSTAAPIVGGTPTPTPTPTDPALNYRGENISDTAIGNAALTYKSYDEPDFLDQIKKRLKEKFKPENESLGVGTFASQFGLSNPAGVSAGLQEKSDTIRRKGTLALQAISTGTEAYAAHAKIALDEFNRLNDMRDSYDKTQKDAEGQIQDLALTIAKAGGQIPDAMLDLLPKNQVEGYKQLANIFKAENARKGSGGGGGGGSTGAGSNKLLDMLDVNGYNDTYPDAGVMIGDTEAQAIAKVQASNSPEAQTRAYISGLQSDGKTIEDAISEINNDSTLPIDKAQAIAIANEVYGVSGGSTEEASAPSYGQGVYDNVEIKQRINQLSNLKKETLRQILVRDGYSKDSIYNETASTGERVIDDISDFLFRRK